MLVETTPSDPSGTTTSAQPVVRVVDDEPMIRALFERVAAKSDFAVETYATAEDFLADFDDSAPGCLVIDLMLPDRSGIEVLQDIKRRGSQLPVVFMSGMARVSEAVEALKLGSIDFVEKPFDMQQIAAVLHRAVETDVQRRRSGASLRDYRQRFAALTPREQQVMEQIVRGAANK